MYRIESNEQKINHSDIENITFAVINKIFAAFVLESNQLLFVDNSRICCDVYMVLLALSWCVVAAVEFRFLVARITIILFFW